MADVKVCDRCGKKIDLGSHRTVILDTYIWYGALVGSRYTDSRNDLCPDCIVELKKFLNGEATYAVTKE